MRNPTPQEIREINELAAKVFDWNVQFEPGRIAIFENYMSDGPSYSGKLAVCFGGESCFVNVVEYDGGAPVTIGTAELSPEDYRP